MDYYDDHGYNEDDAEEDIAELEGVLKHETDKAYLIDFGYKEPVWLPKSLVSSQDDEKKIWLIPYWLAEKKEIV